MDVHLHGQGHPLRVYLVRHGETEWSLTGQHTGRTDMALTLRGEDEARSLRPSLCALHFDRVLTSPLQRARRTCTLAGLGLAAEIEPDLAEWDYGQFEGRISKDIRRDRPGWSCYHDGCPGGESPDDISRRADRIVARLCTFGGNVAVSLMVSSVAAWRRDGSALRCGRASTFNSAPRRSASLPSIRAIPGCP